MQAELEILMIAAVTVACLHTVTGPDHYLPFIALSKSSGWSFTKTICWTLVCGCGHVWSSVLLGLGGAAIGWALSRVKWVENIRGGGTGGALIGCGVLDGVWGLFGSCRNRP